MALPPASTTDGYETQFGTNHVGHAFLIHLLLPILLKTAEQPSADVRVVCLTSQGYRMASGIQFDRLHTSQEWGTGGPWKRYAQSKLANLLYAAALAKHYPNITFVSIHPGVVATELVDSQPWYNKLLITVTNPTGFLTPDEGTWNQLWAATTKKENIVNGEYYEPIGKVGGHTKASRDTKLQDELWEWTQKELENHKP